MESKLYYECHVTVEPLFGDGFDKFKELCAVHGFRAADLFLQKRAEDTPERSAKDSFCTTRGVDYDDVEHRMVGLVADLRAHTIKVWRYKIEDTIIDSKINDKLNLLTEQ